jgi:hypothetical protein
LKADGKILPLERQRLSTLVSNAEY